MLFAREGSRKPELTEAGRALLLDARAMADEADGLMARARGIRQGLETVAIGGGHLARSALDQQERVASPADAGGNEPCGIRRE